MMNDCLPQYLIIGHLAKDILPDGHLVGGTCSYSALMAHQLGQKVAAVTSRGPDMPSLAPLEEIELTIVAASQSTTFENSYQNGTRYQKWLATGEPLTLADVPSAWREAPIVHLGPIAQEMSPSLCRHFPDSLVCVTVQGWLRGRAANNQVIYQSHPELEANLPYIDILVVSLADVAGNRQMLTHLVTTVKLGVETLGSEGCRVYYEGQQVVIPVKPEEEVDPTGAGDIFATAFFIRYHQTGDWLTAARFANTCAALSVGRVGLAGMPTLAEVETRMAENYSD